MAEYIERKSVIESIIGEPTESHYPSWYADKIKNIQAADVAPVVHESCEVCRGESVITQDCDNGYSIEVDAEQSELSVWYGDQCLAVFSIDFCPNCGAKMDGVSN